MKDDNTTATTPAVRVTAMRDRRRAGHRFQRKVPLSFEPGELSEKEIAMLEGDDLLKVERDDALDDSTDAKTTSKPQGRAKKGTAAKADATVQVNADPAKPAGQV